MSACTTTLSPWHKSTGPAAIAVAVGLACTVSNALTEVAGGSQIPVTTQRYLYPSIPVVAPVSVSVGVVVPEYGAVSERLTNPDPGFTCHWYLRPEPMPAILKLAL